MRNLTITAALVVALTAPTPAWAGSRFAAYEGRGALAEGQGGTKVTTDGVDFWTTGSPPRKYQILGVLTDQRGSGLFSGSPTGSGVAKKITSLGGSAAILLGSESEVSGAMVTNGVVGVARRNTTQLLVVKYLD